MTVLGIQATIQGWERSERNNNLNKHLNTYLGYIRVSTARQGERGVSLPEQKAAIERYAYKAGLTISEWFEERETAAKRGRPVWARMLKELRKGKIRGVIIHKIDRSARNLRDWADLGELIDQGIEVHFANESLDLNSRGGRLSADIQAVVASDYIRNLREEAKKGIYGRLKQGYYPMRAPVGYCDNGAAKPKTVDPVKGPLVRQAFDLYVTAQWSLPRLVDELHRRGLRNRGGGKVTMNGLHKILRNPFYTGVIRIKASGQTYEGNHEAIVPKRIFDTVQDVLHGRVGTRTQMHDFVFRRFVKCAHCGRSLIGDLKKGNVYYRCHTRTCPTTSLREDIIAAEVEQRLSALRFTHAEKDYFAARIRALKATWFADREREAEALSIKIAQLTERLNRVTDAWIDGTLDREIFEDRKAALIAERRALTDRRADFEANRASVPDELEKFVELAGSAYLLYRNASVEKKRRLLRLLMSNCTADRKTLGFTYFIPFQMLAEREPETDGGPSSKIGRTPARTFARIFRYFSEHPGIGLRLEE